MWLRRFIGMMSAVGLIFASSVGAALAPSALATPELRPGNHDSIVVIKDLRAQVRDLQDRLDALRERLGSSTDDEPYVAEQLGSQPTAPEPSYSGGYGVPLCPAACVWCESRNDPQAVDSSGSYWGLFQFDYQTWVAHGGDPNGYGSAGASEQHTVAARISYDAWPIC